MIENYNVCSYHGKKFITDITRQRYRPAAKIAYYIFNEKNFPLKKDQSLFFIILIKKTYRTLKNKELKFFEEL